MNCWLKEGVRRSILGRGNSRNKTRKHESISYSIFVLEPMRRKFWILYTLQSCVFLVFCKIFHQVSHQLILQSVLTLILQSVLTLILQSVLTLEHAFFLVHEPTNLPKITILCIFFYFRRGNFPQFLLLSGSTNDWVRVKIRWNCIEYPSKWTTKWFFSEFK